MTGEQFTAWRARMRWNKSRACAGLGLSRLTLMRYESDAATIPRYVALACWALEMQQWTFAGASWEQFERGEVPSINP